MAKIAKPDNKGIPPKIDSKGVPPSFIEQSNNLTKDEGNKRVIINFNATAEFRKELKIYAAELGITVTDLIMEAIQLHKQLRK
jgi:hypothetical protein